MEPPTPLQSQEHKARQWLLDLCTAESGSGQEARILPALLPILRDLGAQVECQEPASGRVNVLATWGVPRVLFSTHLDTVPPFLPVRVDGDRVFGRGACDAKGQIVAQLLAIDHLRKESPGGFAWLGVCGEETDSLGARSARVWKDRFTQCRALINGEPTHLKLATGQRGILHLHLACSGIAAHSGSPERGDSATFALLDWLETLRQQPSVTHPDLGPEVWNLSKLQGGGPPNVIPDGAEAEVLVRTLPDSLFHHHAQATCPRRGRITVLLEEPCDRYPSLPGFDHEAMPFGSDAPQLRDLIPDRTVVLAGPGSIHVAHTPEEHLSLSELAEGIDLNRRLALHFLESQP